MFGETHVALMYALAGRDLALALLDNNGRPVTDHRGAPLVASDQWGRQDEVSLSAAEERWLRHIDATSCLAVDRSTIARPVVLTAGGHVLAASTLHQARLVPLLAKDTFSGFPAGARARGTGSTLDRPDAAGWAVLDEGHGPSDWTVQEEGDPPGRSVQQRADVSAGAAGRDAAFPGGTLLIRGPDPRLPADGADQPGEWTDYRVSAFIRSSDDDVAGIGVRWSKRSGYLLTLDVSRGRYRLLNVVDGVGTVLAEAAHRHDPGLDHLVSLQVIGDRIEAFVDGAPVLDATDDRLPAGSVALHSGVSAGARFAEVRSTTCVRSRPSRTASTSRPRPSSTCSTT